METIGVHCVTSDWENLSDESWLPKVKRDGVFKVLKFHNVRLSGVVGTKQPLRKCLYYQSALGR